MKAVSEKDDHDFLMGVVPEEVAAREFQPHDRTVGRFTDHSLFPGDMFALSYSGIKRGEKTIRRFAEGRKTRSFWTAVWFIATKPRTWSKLIKVFRRKASTKDAIEIFQIAFRCKADIVIVEDLGFGYDMDLHKDYKRLEKYLLKTKLKGKK